MSLRSFFVKEIKVKLKPETEFMTLNVLLKIEGIIDTGGMAKIFLQENEVLVNGEPENRRGRKLYAGDIIEVLGARYVIVK